MDFRLVENLVDLLDQSMDNSKVEQLVRTMAQMLGKNWALCWVHYWVE